MEFTKTSSRPSFNVEAWYDVEYATAERFEAPEMMIQSTSRTEMKAEPTKLCMQIKEPKNSWSMHSADRAWYLGRERCLYLDVLRPADYALDIDGLLPVMVYIHGGGMVVGSKQNYNFKDGLKMFVAEGVIVVSINYRLGLFGAFIDPASPTSSGLWGLKDQIKALEWVQAHIAEFDGDKDRVTIFGQSGGGMSVTALYASPHAKGLFHRAIAQSPGWQIPAQYQNPSQAAAMSSATRCINLCHWGSMLCMRNRWASSLLLQCGGYSLTNHFLTGETGIRLWNGYDGDGTNLPNDDGHVEPYLKQDLYTATCDLQPPTGSDVPLLIGSNKYEWTFFDDDKAIYNKGKILDNFLRQRIKGYTDSSTEKKLCVVNTLLDNYKDFDSPGHNFSPMLCLPLVPSCCLPCTRNPTPIGISWTPQGHVPLKEKTFLRMGTNCAFSMTH